MRDIGLIIAYNRRINAAVDDRRIEDAAKWMCRLHKLENKNGVPVGSFRLREA